MSEYYFVRFVLFIYELVFVACLIIGGGGLIATLLYEEIRPAIAEFQREFGVFVPRPILGGGSLFLLYTGLGGLLFVQLAKATVDTARTTASLKKIALAQLKLMQQSMIDQPDNLPAETDRPAPELGPAER